LNLYATNIQRLKYKTVIFKSGLTWTGIVIINRVLESYSINSTFITSYSINRTLTSYSIHRTLSSYSINRTLASYSINRTLTSYSVNRTFMANYSINRTLMANYSFIEYW